MRQSLTDEELGQAMLRWIEVTQQLEEIGYQLGRIKAQYAEAQYPEEIRTLQDLEPARQRKAELQQRERELYSQSCRLGNEQANLDEKIRATLPVNVWYRVDGHRLRWAGDASPRLAYEEVRELEKAA
jgi:DNA-binding transcriptional MerR regulator